MLPNKREPVFGDHSYLLSVAVSRSQLASVADSGQVIVQEVAALQTSSALASGQITTVG